MGSKHTKHTNSNDRNDNLKYQIIRKLGNGTYGVIYEVIDTNNEKYVMKRINKNKLYGLGLTKRDVLVEVFSLKNLSVYPECDPHIVCYKESYEDKINYYIIMQYIDGMDLVDYIEHLGGLNLDMDNTDKVLNIMNQCLLGLNRIHQGGYAHRDIKLENIMIGTDEQIYIIDFGFACNGITIECISEKGSLPYIPPELAMGKQSDELELAQKHDIWSMGIVFYVLVTGNFFI